MIELEKCPKCGSKSIELRYASSTKQSMACVKCGLHAPFTAEDKIYATWNAMCEEIRIGKLAISHKPKGHRFIGSSGNNTPNGIPGEGYINISFEPIPAPPTEQSVLKGYRDETQQRIDNAIESDNQVDFGILTRKLAEIDAVLSKEMEG